jgi:outer membrane cobalamin receptor
MRAASFFCVKGEAFSLGRYPAHTPAVVLLLAGLFLCPGERASAQQDTTSVRKPDSLRTYLFDEVVVTSQRIPRPALTSPSHVQVLSRRDLEAIGGTSLATTLAAAGGVFVKDYGGVSGLKTISQRGLGTEHTLLLLNGLPANSTHNGGFDLGLFSSFDIGSVEIVQGGQSALQGAHAVAGIVNVLTRTMDEGTSLEGGMTTGSFGYRNYHVAGGDGASALRWRVSASRETSNEDYPFVFRNGPTSQPLVRTNADVSADRLTASCTASIGANVSFSAMAALMDAERGVPGVVTGPFSAGQGRQTDRTALAQASVTATPGPLVTWETRVQGQHTYQRYRDPGLLIGFVPVDNYTITREVLLESHVGVDAVPGTRLYAGVDLALVRGDGNTYRTESRRGAWGAAIAAEQMLLGSKNSFHAVLFPAIRYDRVSSSLDAWSPQLGLFVHCPVEMPALFRGASVRLRAMASRNFRAPTFNELYYAGGGGVGNPGLRPERSTGYEAGIGWSGIWMGEHRIDATGFVTDMTDRIVWVSAPGGNVTPRNLRRVDARGVGMTYGLAHGGLRFNANYSRQRSLKMSEDYPGDPNTHVPVIYTPEESAALQGGYTFDPGLSCCDAIDLSAGYSFVGHRYTSEDAQGFLPAYHVMTAGAGAHLKYRGLRLRVHVQLENVLDAAYEVMAGYPMPPRSFRLSCDIAY